MKHKKLSENEIKVYSVDSDAFTIHENDLTRVMGKPNHFIKPYQTGISHFEEGIGKWRLTNKSTIFQTNKYIFRYNDLIEIQKLDNEPIQVVDEWDTPGICKQIGKQNPCMIRAKFAGSGKSYIGPYFNRVHKQILFVVPLNRLSQEIEGDTTTYNIF